MSRKFMEQYGHLPVEFLPPKDMNGSYTVTRGLHPGLLRLTPLATLPHGLIPRKGTHLQPPKFHYGWPLAGSQFQAAGRKHGFLVMENDNLSDLSEDEDPASYTPIPDYDASMDNLIPMLQNMGVKWCKLDYVTICHKKMLGMSVTTNYTRDNRTPPAEELAIVQEFLGLDIPPAWIVDGPMGIWQHRTMRIPKRRVQ